jgi:DNA-binding MarR family transcriptional regulator
MTDKNVSNMLTDHGGMAAMSEAPPSETFGGRLPPKAARMLFLREEELRLAQDLLFFGYRDFTAGADRILAELGMGRAHHRVLHFVGRAPGITVGDLLAILAITKQSLGRTLQPLQTEGFVRQTTGRADRRQRLLSLTEAGAELERRVFEAQREWVLRAYREAGPEAVEGFRRVMRGLMGPEARAQFEALERARPMGAPR